MEVACDRIKRFAHEQTDASPVLEIPVVEFKALLADLADLYNQISQMCHDTGIIRGHDMGRMTSEASNSITTARSPTEKILLLTAHTRRLIVKVHGALKSRPQTGKIVQVCSKIQARALQIMDYLKTYGEGDPRRTRDVSVDSAQCRLIFTDKGVSRRDTIRSMKRAEQLWNDLQCAHKPNDGRQTMRLTISRDDLQNCPEMAYGSLWQRSREKVGLCL